MKLYQCLKEDYSKLGKPGFFGMLKGYLFPRKTMFRYIVWLRITQKIKKNKALKLIFGLPTYLFLNHYEFKYGIHVDTNIEIGEGLRIVHGDGVYLSCAKIGRNFTCFQSVTLGQNYGGVPTVGDNVTVYAGAVVVGKITLGDNSTIGANAFVSRAVEEDAVYAGNPAVKVGATSAKSHLKKI